MVLVTPSPEGGEVTPDGTKKKKLTTIEKSDGRRLVEYLVVVSSVPRPAEAAGENNPNGQEMNLSTSFDDENLEFSHGFKPEITARYPLYDHEDNPLHENLTFFCHPSGSMHLKAESHMPKVSMIIYIIALQKIVCDLWSTTPTPINQAYPITADHMHLTFCMLTLL